MELRAGDKGERLLDGGVWRGGGAALPEGAAVVSRTTADDGIQSQGCLMEP